MTTHNEHLLELVKSKVVLCGLNKPVLKPIYKKQAFRDLINIVIAMTIAITSNSAAMRVKTVELNMAVGDSI
jgi:hypothetical protein